MPLLLPGRDVDSVLAVPRDDVAVGWVRAADRVLAGTPDRDAVRVPLRDAAVRADADVVARDRDATGCVEADPVSAEVRDRETSNHGARGGDGKAVRSGRARPVDRDERNAPPLVARLRRRVDRGRGRDVRQLR